jgi:hypothetical protein
MRLWPLVFGAPVCVLWLLFFTFFPLPAMIVLLIALAWQDHRHRRVKIRAHPAADDVDAVSK